jgi:hypothetical protein
MFGKIKTFFACLAIVFTLAVILSSCESKIEPTPPVIHREKTLPEERKSIINIPVHLKIDEIEDVVNDKVPLKVYQTSGIRINKSVTMDLDIVRTGNIVMKGSGSYINSKTPVRINSHLHYKKCKSFFNKDPVCFKAGAKAKLDVVLELSTHIGIDDSWNITSETGYSYELKDAIVSVGPFHIDVENYVRPILNREIPKQIPKIDQKIRDTLDVKKYVEFAWRKMNQSILIYEKYGVWLHITPEKVYMTSFNNDEDSINVIAGVEAFIQTYIGEKPILRATEDMPSLEKVDEIENKFNIILPVLMNIDEAKNILSKNINGKKFKVRDDIEIKVLKSNLYGNGDNLVVVVKFAAKLPHRIFDTKGKVYFEGQPYYDAKTRSIKVKSFDYDANTKNVLAQSAAWMLHDNFLEAIHNKLEFPIGEQLSLAQNLFQKTINSDPIPGVDFTSKIQTIEIEGIYITDDMIMVNFLTSGTMNIQPDVEKIAEKY